MAQQTARLTFTGAEDYLEITWPTVYALRRYTRSIVVDGEVIVDVNFTIDDGTTLRVEPTARFSGTVDVTNVEVLS